MPAPLARGLIISLSILVAAGLAAYENPQIRAWFDESRRRIAVALHGIGDEIQPWREDASMREDRSPEAEAHRQRVRVEILQRAQVLRERQSQLDALEMRMRGTGPTPKRRNTTSFDDIVDLEGKLKREEAEQAASTAAVRAPTESCLRKRKPKRDTAVGTQEVTPAAATGQSLLDAAEEVSPNLPPPMPLSPTLVSDARPLSSASSAKSSLHAVQLTPTTSRAPSTFYRDGDDLTPSTMTKETGGGARSQPQSPPAPRSPPPPTDFRSVHEWAENSTASFYSPPQSARGGSPVMWPGSGRISSVASVIGSADVMSEGELLSEAGSALRTPETWTEVGSVVSEN